jgi:hypothetical protein
MPFRFTFTGLATRGYAHFRKWREEIKAISNRPAAAKDANASKGPSMYIIARNITGPRLRCEALMVDKKSFTPWPPVSEDGWRRAYKFRDRLMAEVVRLEADPMGEELKVIEAVYIP